VRRRGDKNNNERLRSTWKPRNKNSNNNNNKKRMSEQRFSRPFASRHAPLFSESIGAQCVSSFKSIKEKKKKKKKKGKDDFTYLENFVSN